MLLLDVAFLTLLMQRLGQLIQPAGRMRPTDPVEGFVWPIFVVVKVSSILTTCPYFDAFDFHIFDAGGTQSNFIASVTIAVRILSFERVLLLSIRTLSAHWLN